ncbi:MAG TPA: phosphoesterase, partial [Terriglobales bacterium]|nr:phosphoesterase [Terriglobales bacterium]
HERTYDFQGDVANNIPLQQGQPDPNEPGTGYLWTSAARHHLTYRNYQEFIPTAWCDSPPSSWGGAPRPEDNCPAGKYLHKGDPLPAELQYPGQPATVEFPWLVPVVAHNNATKPELVGHFNPRYADFRLDYPDQYRANIFLNEFATWVNDRKNGRDTMPQLITMALPNDHTSALRPNFGTPDALVADNDLALGRIVEAISHSPYWDDTAICVLEDDAQDGVDHVDAHRSIALIISKYGPAKGTVESHFYTTVNMVRTIEALLGLPPMNNNDAHAAVMAPLFSGDGSQAPFTANTSNRENGRIYKVNPARGAGAAASAKLDWSRPDAANNVVMNRILWRAAMGKKKMPAARHAVFPAGARAADEDDR